jgi:hypothetical protein
MIGAMMISAWAKSRGLGFDTPGNSVSIVENTWSTVDYTGGCNTLMPKNSSNFYITLFKRDGQPVGHKISSTLPTLDGSLPPKAQHPPEPTSLTPANSSLNFASVSRAFVSMMESYRKFVPLTLHVAPLLYPAIAEQKIAEFLHNKGKERLSLSTETATVYELDVGCYTEFRVYHDQVVAMNEGARLLPEVMVIGLISSYDAFLSQLLRVILSIHPRNRPYIREINQILRVVSIFVN